MTNQLDNYISDNKYSCICAHGGFHFIKVIILNDNYNEGRSLGGGEKGIYHKVVIHGK